MYCWTQTHVNYAYLRRLLISFFTAIPIWHACLKDFSIGCVSNQYFRLETLVWVALRPDLLKHRCQVSIVADVFPATVSERIHSPAMVYCRSQEFCINEKAEIFLQLLVAQVASIHYVCFPSRPLTIDQDVLHNLQVRPLWESEFYHNNFTI